MTKRQYEHAARVLKADCKIIGTFMDCKKNTCAVGALALASGVSERRLLSNQDIGIGNADESRGVRTIARDINNKFGLAVVDLLRIQTANDGELRRDSRVSRVMRVLKDIYKSYQK